MTSAKDQFDQYYREFQAYEIMEQEEYNKLALYQLRKQAIFPPVRENPLNFIVLLQGLPVVKPEKLKSLMYKIALSMVKSVTETFKRDYLLLNPQGGSCLLRFMEQHEAKQFVQLFNGSKEVFGINYPLYAYLFSSVYKYLNVAPPVYRSVEHVDFTEQFNHLTSEQVVSRFVLYNGNRYYFCSFNNCLGLYRTGEDTFEKISFSKQGTFVVSQTSDSIYLRTAQLSLSFAIDMGQYDQVSYVVSPCERFLAVMYFREQHDKLLYRAQVYSIFENYIIYTSDEQGAFKYIDLSAQIGFSQAGKYMYQLNSLENELTLYSIAQDVLTIDRIGYIAVPALKYVEFAPCDDLLALFLEKTGIPSYFLLLDPARTQLDPRVFTRNLNITRASFSFSETGDYVAIVAETTQKQEISTMVVQVRLATNFPVRTVKLHPKSKLDAIAVLRDGIVYAHGGKVFTLDDKQQERVLLPLPCNRLYYSEITSVLVCIDATAKDSRGLFKAKVVLLDFKKAVPIISFDGQFRSIQADQYGRYLFVLSDDALTIYAISGYYLFKENYSGHNLILRPEQTSELRITDEMRRALQEKGEQYLHEYIEMENRENASRASSESIQKQKNMEKYRKIFESEAELRIQRANAEERIRRIRVGYPEYLRDAPVPVNYEIKFKIGVSESSRITKEYYDIIAKTGAK